MYQKIKKVNLLFHSKFHEQMVEYGLQQAYQRAMHVFSEVVLFGTDVTYYPEMYSNKRIVKIVACGYCESGDLRKAFKVAHRIEAYMFLFQPTSVALDFKFYAKGEKEPSIKTRFIMNNIQIIGADGMSFSRSFFDLF